MAEPAVQQPLRFLKKREVCEKIGRGKTSLDTLMKNDPTFPKPIKDGKGRSCVNYWYEHEVDQWMAEWARKRRPERDD
ncbi:AlpA family phage regulatory protein [Halomonas elongata]|uniref:helix-turn-helix transcriptional regulator n=1 Tax=Halomonas elongata TaxID=2746 RepID=UPI00255B368F|nr:AlpA family phage regulatory protein [Halomonas elongata]MDL4862068.1 AlpA family phage regulatory protein [Halomonas elongata]